MRTFILCIHKQLLMLTQNIITFIPIVFMTVITDQIKTSVDKHMLATLNY